MRTCLGVLAFLMLLVPFALGIPFYFLLGTDHDKIMAKGTSADGTVTQQETDLSTTVNDQHPVNVTFTYSVNGADKTGEETVWPNNGADIQVGQKVGVKYLGDRAVLTEFKENNVQWISIVLFAVGLPVAFVGLVTLVVLLFTGNRQMSR